MTAAWILFAALIAAIALIAPATAIFIRACKEAEENEKR